MTTADVLDTTDMKKLLTTDVTEVQDARNAKRAAMCLAMVSEMTVDTTDDCEQANDELRGIKAAWDAMEADRQSFTVPLNTVLDRINARFQPHLKTLKAAEQIIKGKIGTFLLGETRRATEAREAAEHNAEAERDRLAQQAESLRAQARAQPGSAASERLEQQAAALEQTADIVIAQPVGVPTFRAAGLSTSTAVTYELTDMLELCKHIATERPDLVVLLKLDDVKTRAMVKMMGLHTVVPGLRVFNKAPTITVR